MSEIGTFTARARKSAELYRKEASPYSAQEYFAMLLEQGAIAREAGNYGIAAALVIRQQGIETIIFGQNTIITEQNPTGHAETNAVMSARRIMQGPPETLEQLIDEGKAIVRNAPHSDQETIVYTTLEPCPMCTTCITNAAIGKVVIATEDTLAGGMLADRFSPNAILWPQIAQEQGMQQILSQNTNPDDPDTFISPQLQDDLNHLFFDTREELDKLLAEQGFASQMPDAITTAAMLVRQD